MKGLAALRASHPWPAVRPGVAPDPHGWLWPATTELLAANLVGADTRVVVELGSWLGESARKILEFAPAATLVCIDHWRGSADHGDNPEWAAKLPTLYETFLRNLWEHRRRVIPLRADTLDGLAKILAAGVAVDVFYVDADHTRERVLTELRAIHAGWRSATIVGDDYNKPGVAAAVQAFAAETGRAFTSNESAFAFPGMEPHA